MRKILIFLVLLIPLINIEALSCDKTYLIETVSSSGLKDYIGCTDDYEEAVSLMRSFESTATNVASIYENGKLVNARYAVVNFSGRDDLITLYNNQNLSGTRYAYIHGDWGSDGAFIDYYPTKKTIKVKISGLAAWTKFSNADIIPISTLYANTVTALRTIRVRSTPEYLSDNSNQVTSIKADTIWNFTEKIEADGYLWYKINYNGEYLYIAGKDLKNGTNYVTEKEAYSFKTYYKVNSSNDLVHYYRRVNSQTSINLGIAPKSIKTGINYYSFDGNYFYETLEKMLDDYYNNTYENAYNYEKPYFNYYMYLPVHSLTGYAASDLDQVIINRGYTKAPDPSVTYYTLANGWTNVSRTGVSALYGQGANFIKSQTTYGVNALLTFGTAINESGTGTSALSLFKNNIFGHGAYDSCPMSCATTYETVADSIMAHAKKTDSSYSKPTNTYYYGSFYGNKGSGFGVNYASDPYWGEKTARLAYQNDLNFGGQDFNSNTLGIKMTAEAVSLKKEPNESSTTIYLLKNNKNNHLVANMSFIVTEKVVNEIGESWYKVYTDSALDQNQNLSDGNYNFDLSYGYIKAEYLYVENNEPTINANNISILRGENFDALKDITATDHEDGDLTNKITYDGNVDINTVGEYKITYTVSDKQRFKTSKEVIITVLPSTAPVIEATDIKVKQYQEFEPKNYVKVYDIYGSEMQEFEVIKNSVNVEIPGTYQVTYKATYESLNITKTINVTVLKDREPVLNASNRIIKLNEAFDLKSGVSASDPEDGDLTSKITYVGTVDNKKIGSYKITYKVIDSAKQEVTKTITITVEDIDYITKDGEFYFNELTFENSKLNLSGYLAIKGMNNRASDQITYDLIARNNETLEDTVISLERWLTNAPERHYNDSKYDYSATWFKGSISLADLEHGEYTLYVRARLGQYETINLFRNVFGKEMTTKATCDDKGYLFRNNNYLNSYPIELFVYENGLISDVPNTNLSNMINSYKAITLDGATLNITGTSYNIGTDYSSNTNVKRNIIFENKETHERYIYDVGSITGSEIALNVSDGFSKVRGWYNATIDLKSLPVGDYIIYVQTMAGSTNDFGELNDIFIKNLSNITSIFENKKITFSLNIEKRFRIEMHIENKD